MAMGRRTRDEAERAIANCRPFQNSTGSMRGIRGSTRDLGWLSSHREHAKIKELLGRATYVVWSYNTPIGCVTEDEDGNVTKVYFDESHSATTSQHQGILRVGFGDFESIGDGPWSRSSRTRRVPRANPPVQYQAQERQPQSDRLVTNHRGVSYDPAVERDTSFERDLAEAGSFDYSNGLDEDRQQATLAQMLDPDYRDPDWTPWLRGDTSLPQGAEERDEHRVRLSGGTWTP